MASHNNEKKGGLLQGNFTLGTYLVVRSTIDRNICYTAHAAGRTWLERFDMQVVEHDVLCLAEDSAFLRFGNGEAVHVDVFDAFLGQAVEENGTSSSFTDNVLYKDVAEDRCGFVHSRQFNRCGVPFIVVRHFLSAGFSSIEKIEDDGFRDDIYHVDVADVDVFHQASSPAAALEAQAHVGTHEGAVVYPDVLHSSAHLAADDKASVPVIDDVVGDDNSPRGLSMPASVFVFARLDADGVVAGVEVAASHDSIGARLKVKGIAVLRVPGIVDGNVVEGDMITAPRMKAPGWRVLECASLDEYLA